MESHARSIAATYSTLKTMEGRDPTFVQVATLNVLHVQSPPQTVPVALLLSIYWQTLVMAHVLSLNTLLIMQHGLACRVLPIV